jgi:hypothetical protein
MFENYVHCNQNIIFDRFDKRKICHPKKKIIEQRVLDNDGMKEVGVLTCLLNTATSSLNESDEHTSPPATPGSRGVHVASSHFSKINASRGNSG